MRNSQQKWILLFALRFSSRFDHVVFLVPHLRCVRRQTYFCSILGVFFAGFVVYLRMRFLFDSFICLVSLVVFLIVLSKGSKAVKLGITTYSARTQQISQLSRFNTTCSYPTNHGCIGVQSENELKKNVQKGARKRGRRKQARRLNMSIAAMLLEQEFQQW